MSQKKNNKKPVVKKKKSLKKKRKKKGRVFDFLTSLFILSGILLLSSLFFFTVTKVQGYGMGQTLENNDRVFVYRKAKVKRFTLVYMNIPNKSKETTIRRVIGLPGEEVKYENNQLYIDGTEITEYFIKEQIVEATNNGYFFTEDFPKVGDQTGLSVRVPKGKYLVLGDNRPYASDSRFYGYVDQKDILGVVTMRLLPVYKIGMW